MTTKFEITQKVKIGLQGDIYGRISAICIRPEATTYEVVWWNNGSRKTAWMSEWEIERRS